MYLIRISHIMLVVAMGIGLPIFIRSYVKYNSKTILTLGCLGLTITAYGTFDHSACGDGCASHALVQKIEEIESTESDCGGCETSCSVSDTVDTQQASVLELEDESSSISAMVVPTGVVLILIAHILNFKHKRACKRKCCSSH